MKSDYDVIVIGAGPAGSAAAETVARQGLDVLMIEKRQEIGEPVRCAEGIFKEGMSDFIEYDPKWVCAEICRASVYAPDGRALRFLQDSNEAACYILDRKIFDRALAKNAANAGSDVRVKTRATGLLIEKGIVGGIKGVSMGKEFEARSRIVIGADGVESKVGRWAGLMSALKPKDIESCAEFTVSGVDIDQEQIELFFGNGIAPGGYLWIFPKGGHEANVGLGILGSRFGGIHPVEYLSRFIDRRFPLCKVLQTVVGAVPVSGFNRRISTGGLMLAGDGARLADPLLGAGIMNAMQSGRIAGKYAAEAVKNGDVSPSSLKKYDDEIMRRMGKALRRNYRIKEIVANAADVQINAMLRALQKNGLENIPMSRLYETVTASGLPAVEIIRALF